jgi:RND family efflux transporter MFP subunit
VTTKAPRDRIADLRIDRTGEEDVSPWPRRIGLLVAAVLLAAAGFWWFLLRETVVEVAAAPVTLSASSRPAISVLDASGYVTARRRATVSSKITGKIVEVLVEEGMVVEEGQVLARLDDSIVRRQLALAEAQLASARSALLEIEVRLAEAERDLRREHELVSAEIASEKDLDAAQAKRDSLDARLTATRDQVVVAERQVSLRRQELEDTLVRAPFDGVAISKNAQPGEMISPMSAGGSFTRTGVSTIVDMGSLEIEVDVNEAYIDRVRPDQRVVATLDAYPQWKIPAHVITIIPAADRQKATVRVRIGFDELGDPRILPDMGVKVSFREEEPSAAEDGAAPVVLVPAAAVRDDGGQMVVFVVSGEAVERRAVSLGGESGAEREVVAGLREGESVVLDPPPDLADGTRVRVRQPDRSHGPRRTSGRQTVASGREDATRATNRRAG